MFQSTHPRGVRLTNKYLKSMKVSFNPRTHEGCDDTLAVYLYLFFCFNPRTHEGCDSLFSIFFYSKIVSIHAPTRGATVYTYKPENPKYQFQSTHPRGVRLYLSNALAALPAFQSTHPRGVRPFEIQNFFPNRGFNPRTHEGCDQQS